MRFLPDPGFEGQSENDVEPIEEAASLESVQLRAALQVLADHTRTPDDCYFCMWDGWGWTVNRIDGTWALEQEKPTSFDPADYRVASGPPPAWAVPGLVDPSDEPAQRPHAPKVVIPNREYFLFRGTASDFGNWDTGQTVSDEDKAHMPDPAFIWPADHAWCITNDVDPHWAGIGADTAVIGQLLADSRLDVVRADPSQEQPLYR